MHPVILRELRASSRRRETWSLRLVYGASAAAAVGFGLLFPGISSRERGLFVLLVLSVAGFILSAFTGAYLTADAVTSEKREGTLGLLFLTPLKGWQMILGKIAVHSGQVAYALLAAFPFFFVPRLLGGVVWSEVLRILLSLALTLVLSLACGILWSTALAEGRRAIQATALSMALLSVVPWFWPLLQAMFYGRGNLQSGVLALSPVTPLVFAFESTYHLRGAFLVSGGSGALIYSRSLACCAAVALLTIALAAWSLPRVWRRTEAGDRFAPRTAGWWWWRRSSSSSSRSRPSAINSRQFPSQPLLWLATRQLSEPAWAKLVRGLAVAWMLLMVVISVTTRHWEPAFITAFCTVYALHALTRLQYALAATRWLNQDKQDRALEAILTTPVTDAELLRAHHCSLQAAFQDPLRLLWALNLGLELTVVLFFDPLHMQGGAWAPFTVFFVGGAMITGGDFMALRWLGLRESLRRPSQLKAAGAVLGLLCGGAWLGLALALIVAGQYQEPEEAACVFAGWVLACLLYDAQLIFSARKWLRPGLRFRVSE